MEKLSYLADSEGLPLAKLENLTSRLALVGNFTFAATKTSLKEEQIYKIFRLACLLFLFVINIDTSARI